MATTDSEPGDPSARQACPTASLVVGLNQRLDKIKKEVLGARDLKMVQKIVPGAKNDNDCLWVLARIYLIFREKTGRNPAEREIVNLVMETELRKKIQGLLNFKP